MEICTLKNRQESPILGVLIRKSLVNGLIQQQAIPRLEDLAKANDDAKLTLYFFSCYDVDFKKKTITGTYYDIKRGLWRKGEFAYPNIIYQRHATSKKDQLLINKLEEDLKKHKVRWINYSRTFNKWEVYKNLVKEEDFRQHLPKTCLYTGPEDLRQMLDRYSKVYLKACQGGRGRQVVCVTRLPNGHYRCSSLINKLQIHKKRNFTSLLKSIQRFFGSKSFIIQQAIDLVTVNDSIIDLRAEVQKDGQGNLMVTAVPVRISKKKAPITTHAASYTFEDCFKKILGYTDQEVLELEDRLCNFLNMAYSCIENAYGAIGEIGIDVGLDKTGRLWIIECNSRSLKVSLYKAYPKETILQFNKNLLDYALYIFNEEDDLTFANLN